MPPLKKPSLKQKKFVREYVKNGGNAKEAAKKVYSVKTDNAAAVVGHNVLHHEMTQQYMHQVLEKQGLSDEKIAQKLDEIIDAGTSKKSLKDASVQDALKAIDTAAKLKDIYPATKSKVETKQQNLNLNLDGKSTDELMKTLEQLTAEAKTFKKMVQDNE